MLNGGSTRRRFLAASGAVLALGALVGCGGSGGSGSVEIYKLSGRGRRVSRAAKKHNANKRFLTFAAADSQRAHPGDKSRVVTLLVSQEEFARLFGSGQLVRDLRHI